MILARRFPPIPDRSPRYSRPEIRFHSCFEQPLDPPGPEAVHEPIPERPSRIVPIRCATSARALLPVSSPLGNGRRSRAAARPRPHTTMSLDSASAGQGAAADRPRRASASSAACGGAGDAAADAAHIRKPIIAPPFRLRHSAAGQEEKHRLIIVCQ
jgi:hypothetical protein